MDVESFQNIEGSEEEAKSHFITGSNFWRGRALSPSKEAFDSRQIVRESLSFELCFCVYTRIVIRALILYIHAFSIRFECFVVNIYLNLDIQRVSWTFHLLLIHHIIHVIYLFNIFTFQVIMAKCSSASQISDVKHKFVCSQKLIDIAKEFNVSPKTIKRLSLDENTPPIG